MSRHHVASGHVAASRGGVKAYIEGQLPTPCIECGNPVTREMKWHVAHIVPASRGGRTTRQNCGPAHATCNLRAGGRLGAHATPHTLEPDIREW